MPMTPSGSASSTLTGGISFTAWTSSGVWSRPVLDRSAWESRATSSRVCPPPYKPKATRCRGSRSSCASSSEGEAAGPIWKSSCSRASTTSAGTPASRRCTGRTLGPCWSMSTSSMRVWCQGAAPSRAEAAPEPGAPGAAEGEGCAVPVVPVGDQYLLVGEQLAPARDRGRVADWPEAVPQPGLVDRVDGGRGLGDVLDRGGGTPSARVQAVDGGEIGAGRLQQAEPVGDRRDHGALVRQDDLTGVVEGHVGHDAPLDPPLAPDRVRLFVQIERRDRVEQQRALVPPRFEQLGGRLVAAGVVPAVAGQDQPHDVVRVHGLVGVARRGRDHVVGRDDHRARVADDRGIEAQPPEGTGGYHGAAKGFIVMTLEL